MTGHGPAVIARSAGLFALAAIAEIGGAYLVWQYARENASAWLGLAGALALTGYGFVATLQPDTNFGAGARRVRRRICCGLSALRRRVRSFRPDRFDLVCAALCVFGVALIMYAPRDGLTTLTAGTAIRAAVVVTGGPCP